VATREVEMASHGIESETLLEFDLTDQEVHEVRWT